METFSASLALCAGNSPVPVNSPHRGQWRGALMFSLSCVWINGWVNNHEAITYYYTDVIMSAMASQITNRTTSCSTVYSGADQRKHQSSASLAFMRGIHRWPVKSPHKGPVTRKTFLFDDVIMHLPIQKYPKRKETGASLIHTWH